MTDQAIVPIKRFDIELNRMRGQIEMVLPGHLAADRAMRTVRSAVMANPGLLQCNRASLWRSVMSSALFGLECDGRQSAIIPFSGQAQWIPMVNGLVTIAFNAGFVVQGNIVRAKDDFDVQLGGTPKLYHKPARGVPHDKDNEVIGAYATAYSRSMPIIFEWMDLPDLIRVRDSSKGYQYAKRNNKHSVWISDFRGMARKTPVRALCNHLPWQVQRAVEVEDEFDAGRVSWAEQDPDGGITVQYAEFTDVDDDEGNRSPIEQRPANAGEINSNGQLVTEDEHKRTQEAEGARLDALKSEGKLDL